MYSVPSKRQLEKLKSLSRHTNLKNSIITFESAQQKFYQHNPDILVNGGREHGLKIINNIKNFKDYENTHNMLPLETTQLSAYLKFGCLSIREVYYRLVEKFKKEILLLDNYFGEIFIII